jgi:hypothetical protein
MDGNQSEMMAEKANNQNDPTAVICNVFVMERESPSLLIAKTLVQMKHSLPKVHDDPTAVICNVYVMERESPSLRIAKTLV